MSISYFTPGSLMRPNRFLLLCPLGRRHMEVSGTAEVSLGTRDEKQTETGAASSERFTSGGGAGTQTLICKAALGKEQAKRPRVSGVAVQEEGLMWPPLCKQGSHFSRSEKWSVKREKGLGSGKGLMGGPR